MSDKRKCTCGCDHCCYENMVTKKINAKNEMDFSYKFARKNCKKCDAWLGDELI